MPSFLLTLAVAVILSIGVACTPSSAQESPSPCAQNPAYCR